MAEMGRLLGEYVGRPSPITECANLSGMVGGGRLFLKREDLNHTGAHKINNALGQALLAKRMGKTRLIAETGAGMHGTASATVAALLGLECIVYMGAVDVARQAPNVSRMKVLGARVVAVREGQATLKEAVDAALAAWVEDTGAFYLLGSVVGPSPHPEIVRTFQAVIGREARRQFLEREGDFPTRWRPAWEAEAMPWDFFRVFSMTRKSSSPGSSPAARVWKGVSGRTRRPW